MKEENKAFLKERFNIDADNYSEAELNEILDSAKLYMESAINITKEQINDLKQQLEESE